MPGLRCFAAIAVLAGVLHASPAPPLTRRNENSPLTPQLLDDFKFYAQHAGAIYCNIDKSSPGDAISCANNGCPLLEQNNVTLAAISKGLVTGIGVYVSVDHVRSEVVMCVRGTTNVRNFITDARFLLKSADDITQGAMVDSGFFAGWNEVSEHSLTGIRAAMAQNPEYRLVIVGHSLGSGTATVATPYVRREFPGADFFGYGAPRAGNDVFAEFVSNQQGAEYRIEHYNDLTASLPPLILGYRHTDMEYWLSTGPATKIDYTLGQVKVCEGIANLSCSGSVLPNPTLVPHRYILWDLYACGGLQLIS